MDEHAFVSYFEDADNVKIWKYTLSSEVFVLH